MTAPSADGKGTAGSGAPANPGAPTLALKLALGFGLLADGVLIAFLIAMAGYVFGGQEGMSGPLPVVVGWSATLAISILSPLLGLTMWRRGRRDLALAMIWLPLMALLFGIVVSLTAAR